MLDLIIFFRAVYSSYTGNLICYGSIPYGTICDAPYGDPHYGKPYHVVEYNEVNNSYMAHYRFSSSIKYIASVDSRPNDFWLGRTFGN
jgi:hypothetical protein